MKVSNKKEPWLLLGGDILLFVFSLWITLCIRLWAIPSGSVFLDHLLPFGILFAVWCFIFFIVGLYEKHTTIFNSRLPLRVLNTQFFNSFLAVAFFYLIPYFGITPKIILFIYIVIFSTLIFVWRIYGQKVFCLMTPERAMILGQGEEMNLLLQEVNTNARFGLQFVFSQDLSRAGEVDFGRDIIERINTLNISIVVVDLQNEIFKKNMPHFYNLLFSKIRFVDINSLYEDIFDRVPLSLLSYSWFIENISSASSATYDTLKRGMDVLISSVVGVISLVFYPFIWLAIKIDDQGPVFIVQNRIGKNNKLVKIIKIRTMSFNDEGEKREGEKNKITRVGGFLRKSRLDEIPQFWNIFKGDLSLIGPRPELPELAKLYEKEVPYYNVRHLIKPGLSGWAQLYHENHPHHGPNIEETKNKLSYDLYYIKNRSLGLDFKIALKTIKALLSRTGK